MYNKTIFKKILRRVVKKLEKGSDKYKDAYLLCNMSREWSEELIDLVGWNMLQAIKMYEVLYYKIKHNDLIFYNAFFKNQDTKFLMFLKKKIDKELLHRGYFKSKPWTYTTHFIFWRWQKG